MLCWGIHHYETHPSPYRRKFNPSLPFASRRSETVLDQVPDAKSECREAAVDIGPTFSIRAKRPLQENPADGQVRQLARIP